MTISINYWQELKRFINSKEIGEIISRREIQHLYHGYLDKKPYGGYSFDKYRRYLTILEILEVVGRGEYKINEHIPKWFNSKNIQRMATNRAILDRIRDVRYGVV